MFSSLQQNLSMLPLVVSYIYCLCLIFHVSNAYIPINFLQASRIRVPISYKINKTLRCQSQPEPATIINAHVNSDLHKSLDRDFASVGLPALVSLAAEPVASIVDAIYVSQLGTVAQAAMGIAISAQFSVAKLYNDPLLKTSTSIVAGKEGEALESSVASAIASAVAIGLIQSAVFFFFASQILNIMGVHSSSEMLQPALSFLKWRSLGIPAATLILVSNGIFRGRGDTKTPLYCTVFGSLLNILLNPILMYTAGMGCAGIGAAAALSQWCTVVPLIVLLNRKVPIRILGRSRAFFAEAVGAYLNAGGLLLLRTLSKIATYAMTSAYAARLGTVPMAAYTVLFNVAFGGSQLCEAISIASQALVARNFPFNTERKRAAARHIIQRSVALGVASTAGLAGLSWVFRDRILRALTQSPEVHAAALEVMPMVLATQLSKGLAYATGGIILGGLDWQWASLGPVLSSVLCVGLLLALPVNLWNIWVSLAVLMAAQVNSSLMLLLVNIFYM